MCRNKSLKKIHHVLLILIAALLFSVIPLAVMAEDDKAADEVAVVQSVEEPEDAADLTDDEEPTDPTEPEDPTDPTEPEIKNGLIEEDGKIYYYDNGVMFTGGYKEVTVDGTVRYYYFQEDGTAFTEGYKPFDKNGKRVYYYFQADGTAFTGGYKEFEQGGKKYYFFFNNDGSAFTDGYKEVVLDGKTRYFYFLANGQGFNTGYKTAEIGGKKYYFYFDSNGQAITDQVKEVSLGTRKTYFLFGSNGRAFTNGYKEVTSGSSTAYYYFLSNGQAYNSGYKTVKINNATEYFYFNSDGKAYTGGLKSVAFGDLKYNYYFQTNGKALRGSWKDDCYYQDNGRQAQNEFLTIKSKKYHFSSNGKVNKGGWFCVGDGYYFADDSGVLATNTVIEQYKLDANGKCDTKYKVIKLVNQHISSGMSDQQKIKSMFDWLVGNNWTYIRDLCHARVGWTWYDGWVDDFADDIMKNSGGNCFRYAALFGLMVKEATGLKVQVVHGSCPEWGNGTTPHGWIIVYQNGDWYVYDPELLKFETLSRPELCYGQLYSYTKQIYHLNGVGSALY